MAFPQHVREEKARFLLSKDPNPIVGAPPGWAHLKPIPSQTPHLQTPSGWGLGFPHMVLGALKPSVCSRTWKFLSRKFLSFNFYIFLYFVYSSIILFCLNLPWKRPILWLFEKSQVSVLLIFFALVFLLPTNWVLGMLSCFFSDLLSWWLSSPVSNLSYTLINVFMKFTFTFRFHCVFIVTQFYSHTAIFLTS